MIYWYITLHAYYTVIYVYEVTPWLWQFGRGKPRLGDLSVEETAERKQAHRDESHKRAVETRRRRKADRT